MNITLQELVENMAVSYEYGISVKDIKGKEYIGEPYQVIKEIYKHRVYDITVRDGKVFITIGLKPMSSRVD